MTAVVTANPVTTRAFLRVLLYGVTDGWVTINWLLTKAGSNRDRASLGTEWFRPDELDAMGWCVDRHADTCVWHGVALRRDKLPWGKRGGLKDCTAITSLWADLDVDNLRTDYRGQPASGHSKNAELYPTLDAAYQALEQLPVEPSLIVESGGGLQPYWLLEEPHLLAGSDLLARWRATCARRLSIADAVFNADRIMRTPGSLNNKRGLIPVPVEITQTNGDPPHRYTVTELLDVLDGLPPRPSLPNSNGTSTRTNGQRSWIDQVVADFNARNNWADILAGEFEYLETTDNGTSYWHAVGAEHEKGASTNSNGTDRLVVYSETAGHRTGWRTIGEGDPVHGATSYDRFSAAMLLARAGDPIEDTSARTEYARQLQAEGYGPAPDDLSWIDGTQRPTGSAPPAVATRLPDEFWTEPQLAHIRQAAHSRQRSADAVLHAVLARIAAITPHTTLLPAIVGTPKPLSYFAAPIATPGVGKSDANNIACELIPAPAYVADQLPIGSGEGLAEVLFDLVEDLDDNRKIRTVKRQVRHNAYLFVDEGQVLGQIGGRNGATLLPALRTIWTGGVLGQTNASRERHRVVPALTYTYGVVAGFQAARVGPLLDDADAGTPQRFGWVYATDPTVPDDPPDWPGPLEWTPPARISGGQTFEVAGEIAAAIRAADLERVRGQTAIDSLDAHGGLYRLKVAGLLAVLEGRRNIDLEDWARAGMVKTASDAVRTNVVNALAHEQQRQERNTSRRLADRAVEADAATHRTRVVDGARKIAGKVHSEPERWTVADLRRSLSKRHREVWDDALDHAIAEGWIIERSEPGQGSDKRSLRPGGKRP